MREITLKELYSETIRLRVTPTQLQKLNEAAATTGETLSAYLRDTVTSSLELTETINQMKDIVGRLERLSNTDAAIVETLLLQRSRASPKELQIIHKAMKQIGITPYGGYKKETS